MKMVSNVRTIAEAKIATDKIAVEDIPKRNDNHRRRKSIQGLFPCFLEG